jgi:hypothetical protein
MGHERAPARSARLIALVISGTIAVVVGSSAANAAPGTRHMHRVAAPRVASGYEQPAMSPMCGAGMKMRAATV